MRPFDPSSYLKDVLGPYLDSTELPGLFERYCLEPADSDDGAIATRCRDVKQLWDMRVERPKYGPLIRLLLERHGEALLTLEDPTERRRAAAEASQADGARVEEAARARTEWEALLAAAVKQNGGLDPLMRANLERAADRTGVDALFARGRLDAAPVASVQSQLTPDERREIKKALTELAQDTGEQRAGLSLFHALGLPGITLDVADIRSHHAELDAANAVRRRGNTRVLYENMLVRAKRVLIDGDPRAYVEGMIGDVRDALAAEGIKAAVDDGVIDEIEAEQLARRAIELGLTPDLARRVVTDIARENGVPLRTAAVVDYIVCATCGHVAPRDRASGHCDQCGDPLSITCPNGECGTVNDASVARCRKCGTNLRQYAEATRKLEGIESLLRAGHLEQTGDELDAIERALGPSEEITRRRRELETALQRARAAWGAAEDAITKRELYAARQMLSQLNTTAGDVPGPEGPPAAERARWVAAQIARAESSLQKARTLTGSDREAALAEALNIASDCREAGDELDRMPAAPPTNVMATMAETHATVSWTASPTPGVTYEVSRTASDGAREIIARSERGLEAIDPRAASGLVVRYDVVATRGASRSAAVSTPPILIARELQGVTIHSGDGEVRINWESVGSQGRVLVTRRDDGSGAEQVLVSDSSGVVDRDVTNGQSYSYQLRIEYAGTDGEPVITRGVKLFAQPSARPVPVAISSAETSSRGVLINYVKPSVGSVTVLRCTDDPGIASGAELDPTELSTIGIPLSNEGTIARDPDSQTGSRWYLPVTVAGTMAVAGPAFRHLALPGVTNVRATDDGSVVRVTWTWPESLRVVLVTWRADRQPDGPDDPDARRQTFRRSEYKDRGGFEIPAPDGGSVFVAVFPASRVGNDVIYGTTTSRDSRAAVTRVKRTDVRYTVRRTGMRKKKLEIDVQAPEGTKLPEIVIVTRPGDLVPRKADDGDVVGYLGGAGPLQSTIDLAGRSTPIAVRLFLNGSSSQSSHRLVDPAIDDLVIR
jgi:hypothetical protein